MPGRLSRFGRRSIPLTPPWTYVEFFEHSPRVQKPERGREGGRDGERDRGGGRERKERKRVFVWKLSLFVR